MKAEAWNQAWMADYGVVLSMEGAWRGVETQYIAASMKLVDTLEEQDLLEKMLEVSKPQQHATSATAGSAPFALSSSTART